MNDHEVLNRQLNTLIPQTVTPLVQDVGIPYGMIFCGSFNLLSRATASGGDRH
jgi:hypothetical protein